ncbi:MAG: hypothetical protein HOL58_09240 [Francisellaceae bacterium]|nr:hypothetical protein [Francisellaceae bacterium]
MDELSLLNTFYEYGPELLVALEFLSLSIGVVAVYSAKKGNIYSCILLYFISSLSIWVAWQSPTAIISITILFSVCLLMYLEGRYTNTHIDLTNGNKIATLSYAKGLLWVMLFFSVLATFLLRVSEIKSLLLLAHM